MNRQDLFARLRPLKPDQRFTPEDVKLIDAIADDLGMGRAGSAPATAASPSGDATTTLAIKHLRREEGTILYAYQDHLSYWTLGTGRLIDKRRGGGISQAENDMLLANDIAKVRAQLAADADTAAAWARVKDDPVRAVALISMGFQMGVGLPGKDDAGLSGFDGTLALIAAGDFAGAAAQALKSTWAKQTPARAKRVTEMLRTGVMA